MSGKKVYLCVGDYYETVAYNADTPCKLRDGTLCYLRDAQEKNIKGDFSIWTGTHWDNNVSLTDKVEIHARLRIELARQITDKEREELVEDLYSLFKQNDIRFIKYVGVSLLP